LGRIGAGTVAKRSRRFQHQSASLWYSGHNRRWKRCGRSIPASQDAIRRARGGEGPTLIECKTYRWYGHSEIDPAKYRTVEELEYWKSRDPIPAMERYLRERGSWADSWKQELLAEFDKEIDEAIEFAEKSPYPGPEEALDHVFSFSIRERELNRKVWARQILSAV
jgi:TPP-dependent pyruvate/acetoin dehydrogenase alpha subunit